MINNRSQGGVGPDISTDGMTYWVSDKQSLSDIHGAYFLTDGTLNLMRHTADRTISGWLRTKTLLSLPGQFQDPKYAYLIPEVAVVGKPETGTLIA